MVPWHVVYILVDHLESDGLRMAIAFDGPRLGTKDVDIKPHLLECKHCKKCAPFTLETETRPTFY